MNGPCGPEALRQAVPFMWARIAECNFGDNQKLLPEDPRICEGWYGKSRSDKYDDPQDI